MNKIISLRKNQGPLIINDYNEYESNIYKDNISSGNKSTASIFSIQQQWMNKSEKCNTLAQGYYRICAGAGNSEHSQFPEDLIKLISNHLYLTVEQDMNEDLQIWVRCFNRVLIDNNINIEEKFNAEFFLKDNEIHFEMTCKMHFNESSLTTFDTERKKQIMNKYAYLITLITDLDTYAKKLKVKNIYSLIREDKYKKSCEKITTCKTKLSTPFGLTAITAFTFFAKVIDSDRNDKDHVISDTSQICIKNREIFKSFLFRDLMKEIVGFNILPFRCRDHKLFFEFTSRLVENGQYITMLNNNLKEHYNHKIPG
ncbi:MAG: hypothetical protein GY730_07220, partial [bacterium]|nr:hypothetical protein [bacterium]